MMRLLRRGGCWFGSGPQRRQNFFQLNPIFPVQGQQDFDIYNVDYKHVLSGTKAISDQTRYQHTKDKLTREIYLNSVFQKTSGQNQEEPEIDQEFGFPIGIHQNFDDFIDIFKREKKLGSNVIGEFQNLVMRLMQKFQAKSELQLIKMFRLNLANTKKHSMKDRIRALLINSAFIKFLKERQVGELPVDCLSLEQLQMFESSEHIQTKKPTGDISREKLEQIVTRRTLEELDSKIRAIEDQIQAKAVADGTYIPTYHPKYGSAITEEDSMNLDYDLNFPRGHTTLTKTNEAPYGSSQIQDRYISTKINRLFFAEVVKRIQSHKQVEPQKLIKLHDLPLNIRKNDKLINELLFKYKEQDLLVEPDLEDIYSEIDMVLKKVAVKVVPNYIDNEQQNQVGARSEGSAVKERTLSKDLLLWRNLDAEEIFQPELYNEEEVNKVKIQQKQLAELSPSSILELSLNKMPFNLYRHSDLDNFAVFTKYRKKIYQDYLTDKVIDPQIEFKYFSLDQAQQKLKKLKKPEEVPDKVYGYARRKSTEAEVFVTKGTGRVLINKEPLADYCGDVYHRGEALKPLIFTQTAGQFDIEFTVVGGGIHSQAECMAMALTKALIMINPKFEPVLAGVGLVGTDDRIKEPKRIGLYSARVRPPFVRR